MEEYGLPLWAGMGPQGRVVDVAQSQAIRAASEGGSDNDRM